MLRTSKPVPVTKAQARAIWLNAQRLDTRAPFGEGAAATTAAVEHLGYVQIDTINVIERCHHHILFTRIPSYRREHLAHAQSGDKSVFEYWTHALSYVPVRDMRFFVGDMKRHRKEKGRWWGTVQPKDLRKVMRLIRTEGALTIRDIEDDVLVDKQHLWASRKPSKRALELAFYNGFLAVSRRDGMLKTYDLMERHFGWETMPKAASERERLGYQLDRALRAQGVVSLDSICHLAASEKPAIRGVIEARVRRGELVPVAIERADQGSRRSEHWTAPELIETTHAQQTDLVHILSPFDPLVIQRRRTHLFFDYEHRFEAYVPKEKRMLGYFALPVLVGDRIVAALDLKTDRQNKKLLMQKWTWIAKGGRRELRELIEDELHRFERFQLG